MIQKAQKNNTLRAWLDLELVEIYLILDAMRRINRIKEVLIIQGKTQVWLASEIGKEVHTVSLWCTNKRQPSLTDLVRIADVLEIDVRELLVQTR